MIPFLLVHFLLKFIIINAHINSTRATNSFCKALSKLDTKMIALDSNISKVNSYSKAQAIALNNA